MGWPSSVAVAAVVAAASFLPPSAAGQNATREQASDGPVILAVGESTTAGYGVPRERSYPAQLQAELDKRGYRYRVVNQGVSGSTTEAALTRLSRGMALLPKIVIIALGGNDSGGRVPLSRTRANLARLISMYRRVGAIVLVANRNLPADSGRDSMSMYATLAAEHGAVLVPPLLTGVEGHPELLLSDGRHPNAEGYTVVVRNLLTALEPHLIDASNKSHP